MVLDGSELPDSTQATVVEFLDEVPGSAWEVASVDRSNLLDRQPEVELAKYLSRPVLIKSHVWSQADSFSTTTTWFPWHLFFNSAPIKNKLNNYAFINCKLKVKFVVNASPFYSGAMAFTYCPLQNLQGNNIIADASGGELVSYSQRPKVWIFPQTCEGGELTLPFFYHKNWLDITSAQSTRDMGTITPCLYAPLVSANGVTGTSIVVNVYAWAEDIKLHAPTTKLALQSDEFDYKPSQISSSVAAATSKLSRVPLIGPYMTATSRVASSIAKVASSLGFTNVPNIDTVSAYKPGAFPQNTTCEISVPTDRSGVDPKNEVTIDPRTVGLDGKDELDIAYLAGREAWLGNAILSSTDAVDALTLVSRVTPNLTFSAGGVNPVQFTPMAYLANMFKYWRGDIIFRFKFICTRFHKGRVRVTYDPIGNISTTVPDYTTVFNEVVDIGAEQDLEIRVPYMQAITYLSTGLPNVLGGNNYNLTGGALAPDANSNGLITMRVVNPLSGPVANTAIPVMVFARAAENIEYAWPTTLPAGTTYTPFALQSGEFSYPVNPTQKIAGNSVTDGDPHRNKVHFGERICSLRPLIHRLYYQNLFRGAPATGDTYSIQTSLMSRRLKYPGFDPNGYINATKIIGTGSALYNYVKCNIPQLVSLMFIGQRGSITWSVNLENAVTSYNTSFKRYDSTVIPSDIIKTYSTTAALPGAFAYTAAIGQLEPNNGVALSDQRVQPALTVNFPYYSAYNFQFTNPLNANVGTSEDGTNVDNVALQHTYASASAVYRVNYWAALGHDYNFFFFINTPSLYYINIPNTIF